MNVHNLKKIKKANYKNVNFFHNFFCLLQCYGSRILRRCQIRIEANVINVRGHVQRIETPLSRQHLAAQHTAVRGQLAHKHRTINAIVVPVRVAHTRGVAGRRRVAFAVARAMIGTRVEHERCHDKLGGAEG